MGRPNCSRSLAYCSVISKMARQVATVDRASAVVACCSVRSTTARARGSPGSTSTRSPSTVVSMSTVAVEIVSSIGNGSSSAVTPMLSPDTTKTPSPRSSVVPGRRATTTSSSALAPSTTCDLRPWRAQPPPAAGVAVVRTASGRHTPASAIASVPVHSPDATSANVNDEPASCRQAAYWVMVARNGDGAVARPSSSTRIPTSTKPNPIPPTDSGSPIAGQSSPTIVRHRSRPTSAPPTAS